MTVPVEVTSTLAELGADVVFVGSSVLLAICMVYALKHLAGLIVGETQREGIESIWRRR